MSVSVVNLFLSTVPFSSTWLLLILHGGTQPVSWIICFFIQMYLKSLKNNILDQRETYLFLTLLLK